MTQVFGEEFRREAVRLAQLGRWDERFVAGAYCG
jgi:hypothetical protein